MTETPTMSMRERLARERAKGIAVEIDRASRMGGMWTVDSLADLFAAALIAAHNEAVERCAEVAIDSAAPEPRDDEMGADWCCGYVDACCEISNRIRTLKVETQP